MCDVLQHSCPVLPYSAAAVISLSRTFIAICLKRTTLAVASHARCHLSSLAVPANWIVKANVHLYKRPQQRLLMGLPTAAHLRYPDPSIHCQTFLTGPPTWAVHQLVRTVCFAIICIRLPTCCAARSCAISSRSRFAAAAATLVVLLLLPLPFLLLLGPAPALSCALGCSCHARLEGPPGHNMCQPASIKVFRLPASSVEGALDRAEQELEERVWHQYRGSRGDNDSTFLALCEGLVCGEVHADEKAENRCVD